MEYSYNAPEPAESPRPVCPICGAELSFNTKVYKPRGGAVVGCENCIESWDAEDIF